MGSGFSSFEPEKQSWIDHDIKFDATARDSNLFTLKTKFQEGTQFHLCSGPRNIDGLDYEHWFLADEEETHFLEFGNPVDAYNSRVQITTIPHLPYTVKKSKPITEEERGRMRLIIGMKNYSLCFRNCEHVANYIFRGRWVSDQMLDQGGLMNYFRKYLTSEGSEYLKKVNTFPSSISPNFFKTNSGQKMYSFIDKHYQPKEQVYYLDQEDDTYNIVVIGPTDAGKSNLINVFFNQPVCESLVGHKSVTRDVCFIRGSGSITNMETGMQEERRIVVADTVGLCDTEWDDKKVVELLKHRISSNVSHVDAVFIVFRAGRLIKEYVDSIKKIMTWLKYDKESNHLNFLFLGTHAENIKEDEKERLKMEAVEMLGLKGFEKDEKIEKKFKGVDRDLGTNSAQDSETEDWGYSHLVYVGFPPEEYLNDKGKDQVKKSWEKLQPLLKLQHNRAMESFKGKILEQNQSVFHRIIFKVSSGCVIL